MVVRKDAVLENPVDEELKSQILKIVYDDVDAEPPVGEHYELLSDYEVVGLDPEDLEVVERLDQLHKEGRP